MYIITEEMIKQLCETSVNWRRITTCLGIPDHRNPITSGEMIILRSSSRGEIIRVYMGTFTTALRIKKIQSNSQ